MSDDENSTEGKLSSHKIIDLPNASVELICGVLGYDWATMAFAELKNIGSWQTANIQLFGRQIKSPRLSTWHSDHSYTYSRLTWPPRPWTTPLLKIKKRVEELSNSQFNGVLLNLYRGYP